MQIALGLCCHQVSAGCRSLQQPQDVLDGKSELPFQRFNHSSFEGAVENSADLNELEPKPLQSDIVVSVVKNMQLHMAEAIYQE